MKINKSSRSIIVATLVTSSLIGTSLAQKTSRYFANTYSAPAITWDNEVGGSGSFEMTYEKWVGGSTSTLGPASFTRTYLFSAMTRTGDEWLGSADPGYPGVEPDYASIIGTNGANLPSSNRNSIPLTNPNGGSVSESELRNDVFTAIDDGLINWLGQFTLSSPDPMIEIEGMTLAVDELYLNGSGRGIASQTDEYIQGIYSRPGGGIDIGDNVQQYNHSQTAVFDYVAWDDPDSGHNILQEDEAILYFNSAEITFAETVPEPSGVLLLGLGGFGFLLRRKR